MQAKGDEGQYRYRRDSDPEALQTHQGIDGSAQGRARDQPGPKKQVGREREGIAPEQRRADPLSGLHKRACHVRQPDADLAITLEDGVLRTHGEREHPDRERPHMR